MMGEQLCADVFLDHKVYKCKATDQDECFGKVYLDKENWYH